MIIAGESTLDNTVEITLDLDEEQEDFLSSIFYMFSNLQYIDYEQGLTKYCFLSRNGNKSIFINLVCKPKSAHRDYFLSNI